MTKNFSQKPEVGWALPTTTAIGILGGLSPPNMLHAPAMVSKEMRVNGNRMKENR
jgi:hypothetical protein